MAQHTETELARMAEIEQRIGDLKRERAPLQQQIDAINGEMAYLQQEHYSLRRTPLDRQSVEYQQQIIENRNNFADMQRAEQEALRPAPEPKHPLQLWLEQNRFKFNELDRKAAGGFAAVNALTPQELEFVREYNRKLRSWNTGAYKLDEVKQASAAFVNERQTEQQRITAAIRAEHQERAQRVAELFSGGQGS